MMSNAWVWPNSCAIIYLFTDLHLIEHIERRMEIIIIPRAFPCVRERMVDVQLRICASCKKEGIKWRWFSFGLCFSIYAVRTQLNKWKQLNHHRSLTVALCSTCVLFLLFCLKCLFHRFRGRKASMRIRNKNNDLHTTTAAFRSFLGSLFFFLSFLLTSQLVKLLMLLLMLLNIVFFFF